MILKQGVAVSAANDEKQNSASKGFLHDGFHKLGQFFRRSDGSDDKKPSGKHKRLKIAGLCVLGVVLVSGTVFFVRFKPFYDETKRTVYEVMSNMSKGTFQRDTITKICDADGNTIGRIGYDQYEYVKIGDISEYVTNGYIATEDKDFPIHNGVDWSATFRAGVQLILHRGKITQGGSTITQQVVKNNLLTSERTFERKFVEMFLAQEIEKSYTKADIMEFYCNSNFYGHNCYGIEGAAKYYFGKDASDLTLAEAAMLVQTSNLPSNYNPETNYEVAMSRKEMIVKNMYNEGYISEKEYEQAIAESPELVCKSNPVDDSNSMTTYAVHDAAISLMKSDGFEFKYLIKDEQEAENYKYAYDKAYNEAVDKIRSGGYVINTYFDKKLQDSLQKSTDEALADEAAVTFDGAYVVQSASVAIDSATGHVIAVVGGRTSESDEYNRSYQAMRQPASAIKPLLVYGPALNEGTADTFSVFQDEETKIKGYSPKNSDKEYRGAMNMREAIARSVNTIPVQLYSRMGGDVCLGYLGSMKMDNLYYGEKDSLPVALGGMTYGLTISDMAQGYSVIANGGMLNEATCVSSITTDNDTVVWSDTDEPERVFNQDTAFILTDMLQGTFQEEYGTAHDLKEKGAIWAAKTGTTNHYYDRWMCGYDATSGITLAVWAGCDGKRVKTTLTDHNYAGTIWTDFMKSADNGKKTVDFKVPSTIMLKSSDGKESAVDYSKTGKDVYHSRPEGSDYISKQLQTLLENKAEEESQDDLDEKAKRAVDKYEAFEVSSVEEIPKVDELYYDTLDIVNKASSDLQTKLLERLNSHHDALNKTLETVWNDLKEQQEAEKKAEQVANDEAASQAYAESKLNDLRNARFATAQTYIKAIRSCYVKSDGLTNIITQAEKAVKKCSSYDGYATLLSDFNSAKSYADNLPTRSELDQQALDAQQEAEDAMDDSEGLIIN